MKFLRMNLSSLFLIAVATVLWTEAYFSQRNILAFKKKWSIAQADVVNPGLNALPILLYRKPLIGYRLNTDHLLGVQRIFSEEMILPRELRMWFRVGKNSYADLITNGNENDYTGIRLSTSPLFPSAIYVASHSGKYHSLKKIELILKPGFYTAVLNNDLLTIGDQVINLPPGFLREGKVGAQIAIQDTDLYGLEAVSREKKIVLHFFPEGDRLPVYIRHFLILLAVVLIISKFAKTKDKSISLFLLASGFLALSYSFVIRPQDETIDYVRSKFRIMDSWWKPDGEEAVEEKITELHDGRYFPGIFHCREEGCRMLSSGEIPGPSAGKRIVLFGGSRSMPSLVNKKEESFYFLFDKKLRSRHPDIETINLNSTGLFSERLEKFDEVLSRLNMDVIIIESLSFASEVELIKSFMKKWHEKGVKVIYLRPPVNPARIREDLAPSVIPQLRLGLAADGAAVRDPGSPEILRLTPFFRQARREFPFYFLDPNEFLLSDEHLSSGEIFWDGFHLTGWGQSLYADWLAGKYFEIEDQRLK